MAGGFSIKVNNMAKVLEGIASLEGKAVKVLEKELDAFGLSVVGTAKSLAPADEGLLRNSISYNRRGLTVSIMAAAGYAAYMEFGTKGHAAKYVARLPREWQTFAAQYKGGGGGSLDDFIMAIMDWVKRKKISGTYSTKTKNRTGAKGARDFEDAEVAYGIALAILRNGVKPHPFLYPAYEKARIELIKSLKRNFNL